MNKLSLGLCIAACLAFGFVATAIRGELMPSLGGFVIAYLTVVAIFAVIGFALGFTKLHPLIIIFISIILEYGLSRLLGDKIMNSLLAISTNIQWALIYGVYAGATMGWFIYDYRVKKIASDQTNRI